MILLKKNLSWAVLAVSLVASLSEASSPQGGPSYGYNGGYNNYGGSWQGQVGSVEEKPEEKILPLPPGWTEYFDQTSNQPYYHNAIDGTTTWDRPVAEVDQKSEEEVAGSETNHTDAEAVVEADVSPAGNEKSPGEHGLTESQPGAQPGASEAFSSEYQAPQDPVQSTSEMENTAAIPVDSGEAEIPPGNMPEPESALPQEQNPPAEPGLPPKTESSISLEQGANPAPDQQTPPRVWGMPGQQMAPQQQPWGVNKPVEPTQDGVPPLAGTPGTPSYGEQMPRTQPPSSMGGPGDVPVAQQQQTGGAPPQGSWPQERGMPPHTPQTPSQGAPVKYNRPQSPPGAQPGLGQMQGQPQPTAQSGAQQQAPPRPIPNQPYGGQPPPGYPQQPPRQQQPPQQRPPQGSPYMYGQGYNPNYPPGGNRPPPQGSPYNPYSQYGTYGQQSANQNQLVSQETRQAVRGALGSAWQGILGFGNRTKEAVETARTNVVESAKEAGQSISSTSTNLWGQAKNTFGSFFEPAENSQSPYSLTGAPVPPGQGYNQPPGQYPQGQPGRYPYKPQQPPGAYGYNPNQGYPPRQSPQGPPGGPPYPGRPGQIPPRQGAPQGQGQAQPSPGQQGPNRPPPNSSYPPGYRPPQPRGDVPFPGVGQGPPPQQQRPQQTQWGSPSNPSWQQGPPRNTPPSHPGTQQPPQNQQAKEEKPNPWDHPGLNPDF